MSIMDRQGPYIPFEKPVPVPLVAVDAPPLSRICFNSSWTPLVIGALKVLTRPETYKGSDLEVNFASRSAHDLLAANEVGCGVDVCSPVYVGTADGYQFHSNTLGIGWSPNICADPPCPDIIRVLVGDRRLSAGLADMALKFQDEDTGLLSGIHICEFRAWVTDGTLTPVWNWDYQDCAGADHNQLIPGASFFASDFTMRKWGLSCLGAYTYFITWDGPILCTEV